MLLQSLLMFACCIQCMFILHLLNLLALERELVANLSLSSVKSLATNEKSVMPSNELSNYKLSSVSSAASSSSPLEGVAVTIMLHEPNWFQKRYSMMLINILGNLPDNWALQVFYTGKGQSQSGIDINRGFQRLIRSKKVVLTLIPNELSSRKRKKFQLMTDRWLWDNMLADRVFLFGGNSALCANSPYTIRDFMHYVKRY